MALDMIAEISGSREDWDTAKAILYELGMDRLMEHRDNATWGALGRGEVFAEAEWGRKRMSGDVIVAEGNHGCDFRVTCLVFFRINSRMYDEAVETIKHFLTLLTQRTQMLFVLSFQYEGVYAIRDKERGFEWFWHESR